MRHPITAKLITRSGECEATTERDARSYCESWIETENAAVHTMVHADGDIAVSLYRRDAGRWVRSDGLRQPAPPVTTEPNAEKDRSPHAEAAV